MDEARAGMQIEARVHSGNQTGEQFAWVPAVIVGTRKTSRGLRLTVEAQGSRFFVFAGTAAIREVV